MFEDRSDGARIVQRALANYIHYSFARVGDVTDAAHGIHGIDAVMAHGFAWAPPGAFVDLLGGPQAAATILEAHGFRPPLSLTELPEGTPVCAVENAERFFGG
jgi:hypothetical protein